MAGKCQTDIQVGLHWILLAKYRNNVNTKTNHENDKSSPTEYNGNQWILKYRNKKAPSLQ